MAGFRIPRRFSLSRFNNEGGGLIARLGRKPRVKPKRRVMLSPNSLRVATAEMEARNRRIREANVRRLRWIREANLWVEHRLLEIEDDPLIRDEIERLKAQNLNINNN
ncbi:hypothetical protein HRI_001577500 [Hibiscus trionum]|uniref:Uncharacterized protein n=1 Tax=Hibiscus trionum TaxID=183268 RepID=A0A9W7LVE0_HIBTR|nr:hypothetical protein HRI_001577500 [Hibiscus trionum]